MGRAIRKKYWMQLVLYSYFSFSTLACAHCGEGMAFCANPAAICAKIPARREYASEGGALTLPTSCLDSPHMNLELQNLLQNAGLWEAERNP